MKALIMAIEKITPKLLTEISNIKQIEPPEKSLINAARNGAKDIIEVGMFEEKFVDIIPQKIKTLFTFGLRGCQVVSVIATAKNGNPVAILSHYPPMSLNVQCLGLEKILKQNQHIIDFNKKAEISIALPEWSNCFDKTTEIDEQILNKLQTTINEFFPNNQSRILPYKTIGRKPDDSNAFIVSFPSNPDALIEYQALQTFGDFGKLIKT